jgi:hypothetical protein
MSKICGRLKRIIYGGDIALSSLSRLKTNSIMRANGKTSRAGGTEEARKCDEILENHLDVGFWLIAEFRIVFHVCSL